MNGFYIVHNEYNLKFEIKLQISGGVFITWRQKDPKEPDLGLYGKGEIPYCFSSEDYLNSCFLLFDFVFHFIHMIHFDCFDNFA